MQPLPRPELVYDICADPVYILVVAIEQVFAVRRQSRAHLDALVVDGRIQVDGFTPAAVGAAEADVWNRSDTQLDATVLLDTINASLVLSVRVLCWLRYGPHSDELLPFLRHNC